MRLGFRKLMRKGIDAKNRSRLANTEPTVFSSNCNGGVMLHDLGLRFMSPTVNLFIKPSDYIRFLLNLDHYLYSAKFVEVKGAGYPVGILDDIRIDFVHYGSFEEAVSKWNSRLTRVNMANSFFMMTERDGCTYEDIVAFDSLPYENKVVFVSKPMPEISSAFFDPSFPLEEGGIGVLTNYVSKVSGRRYLDVFDYVSFLNGEGIRAAQ